MLPHRPMQHSSATCRQMGFSVNRNATCSFFRKPTPPSITELPFTLKPAGIRFFWKIIRGLRSCVSPTRFWKKKPTSFFCAQDESLCLSDGLNRKSKARYRQERNWPGRLHSNQNSIRKKIFRRSCRVLFPTTKNRHEKTLLLPRPFPHCYQAQASSMLEKEKPFF